MLGNDVVILSGCMASIISQSLMNDNIYLMRISEKHDGSLITFIDLPDGTIKARTKYSVCNPQNVNSM